MELTGYVQNGVIVLSGGATLPEGTPVKVTSELPYDDESWTDDERDLLRCEALDDLGWDGMDAYQGESK